MRTLNLMYHTCFCKNKKYNLNVVEFEPTTFVIKVQWRLRPSGKCQPSLKFPHLNHDSFNYSEVKLNFRKLALGCYSFTDTKLKGPSKSFNSLSGKIDIYVYSLRALGHHVAIFRNNEKYWQSKAGGRCE